MKKNNSVIPKKVKSFFSELNIKPKTVALAAVGVVCLTAVIVCCYIFGYVFSVANGEKVIDLDEYQANQSQTSIIYAYDEKGDIFELQRLHGNENRIYVSLNEIPKGLQDAFVALEDKRFYKHNGVDWIRFIAVFVKDKLSTGGSSITQQLIKNLTGERDATFVRKFNEITYALNVEKNFEKEQILEAYLNTLYLGEGCYGVKTASEVYFGKDVSELNIAECACLASITQMPYGLDPLVNPDANRKRQLLCLQNMRSEGMISKEEYDQAVAYKMVFTNSPDYVPTKQQEDKKTEVKNEIWSFYVDHIIDSLYDMFVKEYNMTDRQATQKIYYGGLKIYAAVDTKVQKAVEDVYVNRKTFPDESGRDVQAQSAMTVMDYTGRIVAVCGQAGKKTQNRGLNRATSSPRQPGSSIKPISVYAPAIEEGLINWSTLIQDKAFALNGEPWPKNYGGNTGSGGYVTVQNALARSLNTVPARILKYDLTLKKSYQYLTEVFKISTANPNADMDYSPLATGGMHVGATTLEMAAAFATFGNGGKYNEPYCYYRVTNSDGSTIYFDYTANKPEQVISVETANIMCDLLQTVTTASGGTGAAYKINGFQTFAKTGTTTNNYDRWFVGGTPYYVAAVWYGYDLNKAINNVSGNPAGKIFKSVMGTVHQNLASKQFERSSLVTERRYCTKTGLIAGDGCTSTAVGWYSLKNLPSTCTTCHGESSSNDDSTLIDWENPLKPIVDALN